MRKKQKIIFMIMLFLFTLVACKKTDPPNDSGQDDKYTLYFNVDDTKYHSVLLEEGKNVVFPASPSKVGYEFLGWYFDKGTWLDKASVSSFRNVVFNEDINVYAYFEVIKTPVELVFDVQGGNFIASKTIYIGYETGELPIPEKDGYTFVGWYQEPNGKGRKITQNDILTNYTIYAYWQANTYLITLNPAGGKTDVSSITATYGLPLPEALGPTKEGYLFLGYFDIDDVMYFNSLMESQKNFDKLDDTVLYAKWTENSYNLNLEKNIDAAGVVSGAGSYKYNSTVEITAQTNDRYIFSGWYDGAKKLSEELSYTFLMPAQDLSIIAKWEEDTGLLFELKNNVYKVVGYNGDAASVVVPSEYRGILVDEIENSAFSNCSFITSIVLSEGIIKIGNMAFKDCTSLVEIALPESLTKIGDYAFSGCSALTNVLVPESLINIGVSAFFGCSSLVSITIPFVGLSLDGVTDNQLSVLFGGIVPVSLKTVIVKSGVNISNKAFEDCGFITNIVLPNSITNIGSLAFKGCVSLVEITLSDNLTNIGDSAFLGCEALINVYINDINSWLNIDFGDYYSNPLAYDGSLFIDEVLLTELVVPKNITSIKPFVFSGCASLTKVIIPNSVTTIGFSAFKGCNFLDSISLPFLGTSLNGNTHFSYIFGSGQYSYADNFVPSSLKTVIITGDIDKVEQHAFYNCTSIRSIILPDSITSIGSHAFYNCENLTALIIPEGVALINDSAFFGCKNLISIDIPEGITSIEEYTFSDCESLTNIVLPESLISIKQGAFRDCASLLNIIIPEFLESIGSNAFTNCVSLIEVVIPDFVTSVGENAFSGCSSLASLTINNAINRLINIIDNYQALKTVIITGGTSVSEYAFYGFSSITNITLPDSITSVGNNAFNGCTSLKNIIIPASVTSLGNGVFAGCTELIIYLVAKEQPSGWDLNNRPVVCGYVSSDVTSDGFEYAVSLIDEVYGVVITGYNGSLSQLIIPTTIELYPVTTIAALAFDDCDFLENVTISDNITKINDYAFRGCASLENMVIPSNITSIGFGVFRGCVLLNRITLPFVGNSADTTTNTHFGYIFGATNYGANTSAVPASLKTVLITGGSEVDSSSFDGCNSLVSISLPSSVTVVGKNAFYNCNSLIEITLPESLINIGERAFSNCASLINIEFPESLISIGNEAFWGCGSLTSVVIPMSLTSLGLKTFYGCEGLASITLPFVGGSLDGTTNTHFSYIFGSGTVPESLKEVIITGGTSIDDSAFEDCRNLTNIALPDSITSLGERAFFQCNSLTSITLSKNITSIGTYAFSDCSSLDNFVIPEGMQIIEKGVFNGCSSLTSITIPNSITSIGDYAFNKCSISSIVVPISVTSIGLGAFSGCSSLMSITLPFVGKSGGTGFDPEYLFGYIFGSISYTGGSNIKQYYSDSLYKTYYIPTTLEEVIITGGTKISEYAFNNCSILTSIEIPNSVDYMGDYTFLGCSLLTSITLSENITSISSYAFSECSSLINIKIPVSVKSIGAYAFSDCSSLTTVTMLSVNSIGSYAFSNCGSLTNVALPINLITIGSYAFSNCGITSIAVPKYVETIGDYAFDNCTALNTFSMGDYEKDKTIGNYAFNNCISLTDVGIAIRTSIGDYAFCGCGSLTSVIIPEAISIQTIGLGAFSGCSSLMSISLPFIGERGGIGSTPKNLFGYIFGSIPYEEGLSTEQHYSEILSVTYYIPSSLKEVKIAYVSEMSYGAFSNCSNLENITIERINYGMGEYAFLNCTSLKSVSLPEGLTSIASYAFSNCPSLASIVLIEAISHMGSDVFSSCPNLVIYAEVLDKPINWHNNWNPDNLPIYWLGQWSYDENNNPIPNP